MRSGRSMKPTLQGFRASSGIADHERGDHHEGCQHDIKEPVASGIEDKQPQKENHVAIAIDNRIEEGPKDGDLVCLPCHPAIHHIEDSGSDDDQTGIGEHANVVMLIGQSKEHGGGGVDDEANEGKSVGRNTGEGETIHNSLQDDSAASAKGARPAHSASS